MALQIFGIAALWTQKATRGLRTKDKIYYIEKEWKSVPLCPLDNISTTNIKAMHEMSTIDLLVETLIHEAKENNNTLDSFEIPAEFLTIVNRDIINSNNLNTSVFKLDKNIWIALGKWLGFKGTILRQQDSASSRFTRDVDAINKATEAINHYYFHTLADPSHRSKSFWKNFVEHFGVNLYEKLSMLKWDPFAPRPFGVFPMIAINYNTISDYHWDKNDKPNSLCCLVALGDFKGGIRNSVVYFVNSSFFHHLRNFTQEYQDLKNGIDRDADGNRVYKKIRRQNLEVASKLNKETRLLKPKLSQVKIPPQSSDCRRGRIDLSRARNGLSAESNL
ncbi:hypothetical protein C2G38_2169140 [Gigaspora rosea]|uniref:Uncharacterized protein n=1 Tax=Gigaspora rosea TaxID=44941 RepID=A0A397VW71_9GLOM|nr:hypothetical protein C2G38_2169140 [Gigaspora rosea]